MLNPQLKTIKLSERVRIRCIGSDKFTVGRISITMLLPLNKETVASNAMLPFILKRSTKSHPTFIEFNRKLSMLFGASISADVKKIGDYQALTLSAAGIDDKYSIDDINITEEITKLLIEVLFNPNINDGAFPKSDIDQEKRELIDVLDSEINDKRTYAKNRAVELMCNSEPYGLNCLGTKSQINAITSKDLVEALDRAINQAKIEVFVLGLSNPDAAINTIKSAFVGVDNKNITFNQNNPIISSSVKHYEDKLKVSQAKLVMGFRVNTALTDDEIVSTTLMSVIFGGSPNSKLFMNVREKLSLCYYCSANYIKNKGIMLVQSGVEHSNIKKAEIEICNQLESIKSGDISDDEIKAAKLSILNMLGTISDGITSLESYYILQMLDKTLLSPDEYAELIKGVTRDRIIDAAKKIKLDTVYVLTTDSEGGKIDD